MTDVKQETNAVDFITTLTGTDALLVNTDVVNNVLEQIEKDDFISDIISTDSDNLLNVGTDNKLAVIDSAITLQGNTFNGNSQLIQTTSTGKYPALDGSLITNISGGGGGVVDFDNKETVTTNITLAENKITTGYWSGTNTITLPTVTDTSKQVTCILDFTTATSSQPTLNKPALTGTIAVTNASATVTGTSTLFTTELAVGSKITIAGVDYQISTITSNTSLTLSATYSGTTTSGLTAYRNWFKWSDKNKGIAPTAYSILTGIRNVLIFKTIWVSSLLCWEVEYTTYGAVETVFVQPVLTSDTSAGTIGGSGFAVSSTNEQSGFEAFNAFDNQSGNNNYYQCTSGSSLVMYYEKALKVSNFHMQNSDIYNVPVTSGNIYASNDGTNYTLITSFTNTQTSASGVWNIPISSLDFYKYWKLIVGAPSGTFSIGEIDISAVYITT